MAVRDGVPKPSGRHTTLPLHNRPQYSYTHRIKPLPPGRPRNLVGQPHVHHTHTIHTHHHRRRRMPDSHPTLYTSQPHPTKTHPPLGTQSLHMGTNRKTLSEQTPLATFRRENPMGKPPPPKYNPQHSPSYGQSSISANFYKQTPPNTFAPSHSHSPNQTPNPHF